MLAGTSSAVAVAGVTSVEPAIRSRRPVSLRKSEEFYMDKYITDTFISNTFDSNHNTLATIRRVSDIWEWANTVFVPGLFSNADAGEWWPDGDGSFSLQGATPLSTSDMVNEMNAFDWTQGIIFKQARAQTCSVYIRIVALTQATGTVPRRACA